MIKELVLRVREGDYDKYEDSRWYHVGILISRGVWRYIWSENVKNLKDVSKKWAQFAEKIFDIPGVIKIDIQPRAFSVVRNGIGHSEWREIEPKIIRRLKRYIGVESVKIVRLKNNEE